jgi:hypothetical protein
MPLRYAPLRVSIFRPTAGGKTAYREHRRSYGSAQATDVPFDLQLKTGSVAREQFGRMGGSVWAGYGDEGLDLKQDDGVLVESDVNIALTGRRFLVRDDWNVEARGGWQGELEETDDEFG